MDVEAGACLEGEEGFALGVGGGRTRITSDGTGAAVNPGCEGARGVSARGGGLGVATGCDRVAVGELLAAGELVGVTAGRAIGAGAVPGEVAAVGFAGFTV